MINEFEKFCVRVNLYHKRYKETDAVCAILSQKSISDVFENTSLQVDLMKPSFVFSNVLRVFMTVR